MPLVEKLVQVAPKQLGDRGLRPALLLSHRLLGLACPAQQVLDH